MIKINHWRIRFCK